MKCQACGEEVLLAERCPYCGRPTGIRGRAAAGEAAQAASNGRVSGRFVGPMGRSAWREAGPGWSGDDLRTHERLSLLEYVRRLVAYVADPAVPAWKKGLIAAAALYVLMPLDLMPSLVLAGVGWLDDLLVLWLGLPVLARELAAYGPGGRRRR